MAGGAHVEDLPGATDNHERTSQQEPKADLPPLSPRKIYPFSPTINYVPMSPGGKLNQLPTGYWYWLSDNHKFVEIIRR